MKKTSGMLAQLPAPPGARTGWPWTEETSPALYDQPPKSGWPKISIVCPSFQQGQFIEETIRSVLLQNYPALELIVIDGGSTDGTQSILERYSPWLAYWHSERDRGQSHALNQGFARATGHIFGWINSDDFYLPGALIAVARGANPARPQLIYGDHEHLDDASGERQVQRMPDVFGFEIYAGGFSLPSHATFWTAAAHVPLDESLQFIMDADLFKRMTAAGALVKRVNAVIGVFRRHGAAKTATLHARGQLETAQWLARHPKWHWWFRWRAHQVLARLRRAR